MTFADYTVFLSLNDIKVAA